MSNKESSKKNQRKIKPVMRARRQSAAVLRTQAPPGFSLYRFVYKSTTSTVVCFLLVLSFLSQGVSVVYANEVSSGDELVTIQLVEEEASVAALEPESEPEPEVVNDELIIEEEILEDTTETVTTVITDPNDELVEEVIADQEVVVEGPPTEAEETVLDVTENTDDSTSDHSESSVEDSGGASTDDSTSITPDEQVEDPEIIEPEVGQDTTGASDTVEEATSTLPTIGPVLTEPISVNYSDSGFVFSKNECTELASGSFYCLEPRENVLEDALFAAPDKDGDLEIFLVRNGIQTQVTDNFVDDAAPFFDQNSETLVWHRLIDDRYQIISYDLASGEETQITKGSTNNMEPVRQGKYTVWQRWVTNNWDIILYDGVREVQVSHASAHDIAPYIHGALVVWNRYGATGEKTIEMYDITSETYVTVNDPEGLSVTNPRMVLVYDQMHPNGDIVTKGYDMIARKFIQLDSLPRDLPDEIPQSEPTSETRALIQSKPTLKSDEQIQGEPVGVGGAEPPLEGVSGSTTDPLTLDLRTEDAAIDAVVDTPPPELLDYDLVIVPLEIGTSSEASGVQE